MITRAAICALAAWVVLRVLRVGGDAEGIAWTGPVVAAVGAAVAVGALDGMLAVVTWMVIALVAVGLARPGIRRIAAVLVLVSAAFAAAGGVALFRTADALAEARRGTGRLERELLADPAAAEATLAEISGDLDAARRARNTWWARPARFLPVLARHFGLADTVLDASTAVIDASTPLARTTSDELLRSGQIDLVRLGELSGDVARVAALAAAGEARLAEIDRQWVLGPAEAELDDTLADFAEQADRLDRLARFSSATLPYLGADGPARWFVLVCTPSEARATCGFPGNWVEFVIDDGRAELVDSGRLAALEEQAVALGLTLEGPPELVANYGRFDPVPTLRNLTLTPDFPSVAEALTPVLTALGRPRPDVVAAVNTEGLQGVLRVTGPVDTEMGQLNVQSVRPRLEVEQYTRFATQRERREALDSSIRAVVDAVTTLDDVEISKVRRLSEAIDAGGLLAYVPGDPGNVFVEMGVAGVLPSVPLAGVTVQNAGANKLDAFRSVAMTLTPATPSAAGCARIEIALGTAPPGSPDYVVGNAVGLPSGWIRSWVSIYTPTPVVTATLDGRPVRMETRREAGHPVASLYVDTAPSTASSLELVLEPGPIEELQTLVEPSTLPYTVELTDSC